MGDDEYNYDDPPDSNASYDAPGSMNPTTPGYNPDTPGPFTPAGNLYSDHTPSPYSMQPSPSPAGQFHMTPSPASYVPSPGNYIGPSPVGHSPMTPGSLLGQSPMGKIFYNMLLY